MNTKHSKTRTVNFAGKTWFSQNCDWVTVDGDRIQPGACGIPWRINNIEIGRTSGLIEIEAFFASVHQSKQRMKTFISNLIGSEKQIQYELAEEESAYIDFTGDFRGFRAEEDLCGLTRAQLLIDTVYV